MIPAALACLALGFLGGFSFGFKVAAMIRLGAQQAPVWVRKLRQDYRDVKRENQELRRQLGGYSVVPRRSGS
jgi:hypothetical protein